MTGVLLAGGKSARLGQHKYLLPFDGRPLGWHLLCRLRQVTGHQLIVANDPSPFAGWAAPVIPDQFPGRGPLAGIHAGLAAAPDDLILAVACDLPFFSAPLGAHLGSLAAGGEYDVVIPRRGQFLEPLCAVYAKSALPVISRQLCSGDGRVSAALDGLRVRYVEQPERASFGPDEILFLNINSPADLARARALWS
ncbi:MAG: molybdenum cofactor guanylyltransferase [Bacillota bacterium]|nr:molybdenum cofactor guanylyltransferase [Bacillota bacterium]